MNSELTTEKAKNMLARHLRIYHSLTLHDVEITDVKGYWRLKKLCDENCCHPIHTFLGNKDRIHHTISCTEHGVRNEKGQFVSPHRIWNILYNQKNAEGFTRKQEAKQHMKK